MIVELFGPPGVGKTTFAAALTAFLRENGQVVDPVVSYRPAEQGEAGPAGGRALASVRRLARPATEMIATAGHLFGHPEDAARTAELMRLLPTKNPIWSVRLCQYLFRLCHSWHLAASSPHIVLFDQAFVQAVCSLVLLGRAPDRVRTARALDAIPQADLLIRLAAPRQILAARLGERQHRQGLAERLFELDLPTNLASIEIVYDLHTLLRSRGRAVISVDSTDERTRQAEIAKAGAAVLARLAMQSPEPAGLVKRAQHA